MITESILVVFMGLAEVILSLFPSVDFDFPFTVVSGLTGFLKGIGYVMPVKQLMPIFYFSIVFLSAKATVALIVRIKSFIPTMGS